jgi:hypothetical protein
VAVSARVRDGEGWREGEPAFYSVVVWRDQAVHAAESLAKEPGPSLRWATATTIRSTRSGKS